MIKLSDKKQPKKQKKRPAVLAKREKEVLEAIGRNEKTTETARRLGMFPQGVVNARSKLAEKVAKAPELLNELGLGLREGLEKYFKPLLEAEETKFFPHDVKEIVTGEDGDLKLKSNGYVIEERQVAANEIRLRAFDLFAKMHGAYQRDDEINDDRSNTTVINLAVLDPGRARQLLGALESDCRPPVVVAARNEDEGRAGQ